MGYTHYWRLKSDIPQDKFEEIKSNLVKMIDHQSEVTILEKNWNKDEAAIKTKNQCESFFINRTLNHKYSSNPGFFFTKTRRKPYGRIVCGGLLDLKRLMGSKVELASDGLFLDNNWQNGARIYLKAIEGIEDPSREELKKLYIKLIGKEDNLFWGRR